MSTASAKSFLGLPTELRLEVYSYFPNDQQVWITTKVAQKQSAFQSRWYHQSNASFEYECRSPLLQLSRTCTKLHDECRDLWLKQTTFIADFHTGFGNISTYSTSDFRLLTTKYPHDAARIEQLRVYSQSVSTTFLIMSGDGGHRANGYTEADEPADRWAPYLRDYIGKYAHFADGTVDWSEIHIGIGLVQSWLCMEMWSSRDLEFLWESDRGIKTLMRHWLQCPGKRGGCRAWANKVPKLRATLERMRIVDIFEGDVYMGLTWLFDESRGQPHWLNVCEDEGDVGLAALFGEE